MWHSHRYTCSTARAGRFARENRLYRKPVNIPPAVREAPAFTPGRMSRAVSLLCRIWVSHPVCLFYLLRLLCLSPKFLLFHISHQFFLFHLLTLFHRKTGLGHLYPVIGTEFYVPHSYEGLHLAKVKSGFECLVDPSRKYQGCWPLSEQLAT